MDEFSSDQSIPIGVCPGNIYTHTTDYVHIFGSKIGNKSLVIIDTGLTYKTCNGKK